MLFMIDYIKGDIIKTRSKTIFNARSLMSAIMMQQKSLIKIKFTNTRITIYDNKRILLRKLFERLKGISLKIINYFFLIDF